LGEKDFFQYHPSYLAEVFGQRFERTG